MSRNKHILLYNMCDPGVGGLAQYSHLVLCRLVTLGYRVTSVQCQHSSPLTEEQKRLGVQQIWLDFSTSTDLIRILKETDIHCEILLAQQPDLIFFVDGWTLDNVSAKQVAIALGIPYVISVGLVTPEEVNFSYDDAVPYADLVTYQYSSARAVITAAYEHLNFLHDLFKIPTHKTQVIYYGRPPQYFAPPNLATRQRLRQEQGIPEDAVVCFTSARLVPIKGHRFQLQAIAHLKTRPVWQKLYFVWAGTGTGGYIDSEAELRATVKQLEVGDRIKFLGHRWDVPDWLDACDIFVLTSLAEAAPSIAAMEAMAKGVPVVGSAAGGIPEGLGDAGALLPDPNIDSTATVAELARILEQWVLDPSQRQATGQACKARAEKMFKVEPMLEATMNVIGKALLPGDVNRSPVELSSDLKQRLEYADWVWQAWCHYRSQDLEQMAIALQQSLRPSPFLPTETMLQWVKSFTRFAAQTHQPFDVYELTQSRPWKQLTATVLYSKTA